MIDKHAMLRGFERFKQYFSRVDIGDDYVLLESFDHNFFKYIPNVLLGVKRINKRHNIALFKITDSGYFQVRMSLCIKHHPRYYTCIGDEELIAHLVDERGMVGIRHPAWIGELRLVKSKFTHTERTPYYTLYF